MSLNYEERNDEQRAQFWADVACGAAERLTIIQQLDEYVQSCVRFAYLQGMKDARSIDAGQEPSYEGTDEDHN